MDPHVLAPPLPDRITQIVSLPGVAAGKMLCHKLPQLPTLGPKGPDVLLAERWLSG